MLPLLSTHAPIPWIQLTSTWDLVLSPLTVKSLFSLEHEPTGKESSTMTSRVAQCLPPAVGEQGRGAPSPWTLHICFWGPGPWGPMCTHHPLIHWSSPHTTAAWVDGRFVFLFFKVSGIQLYFI